jgi:hypothetical protein
LLQAVCRTRLVEQRDTIAEFLRISGEVSPIRADLPPSAHRTVSICTTFVELLTPRNWTSCPSGGVADATSGTIAFRAKSRQSRYPIATVGVRVLQSDAPRFRVL